MFTCSHLLRRKKLLLLLLVGICCRSVVAAGFMLDTQPANGAWLSVKVCPGAGGLNAWPGSTIGNEHDHRAHHHGHQAEHEDHEHAAQDHAFSTCSFWSASSQLLLQTWVAGDAGHDGIVDETLALVLPTVTLPFTYEHPARAPPVLSSL